MNNPCYSADVVQAMSTVAVVWWALWGLLALGAIAVVFGERERPR